MADTVTSQTIMDTPSKLVMKSTNTSDGTGESAVTKVDVSSFTAGEGGPHSDTSAATCTEVRIDKIWARCNGMSVSVLWDASSDVAPMGEGRTSRDSLVLLSTDDPIPRVEQQELQA